MFYLIFLTEDVIFTAAVTVSTQLSITATLLHHPLLFLPTEIIEHIKPIYYNFLLPSPPEASIGLVKLKAHH